MCNLAAMRILFIIDHPYTGSYSHALLGSAVAGARSAGHNIDVIDLAADCFDPAMSVEELSSWRSGMSVDPRVLDYQDRLLLADHVAFVFPIWWMNVPARTKGFVDKVLLPGVAYDEPKPGGRLVGRLTRLKSVTLMTVSTTPTVWYRLLFRRPAAAAMLKGTFGLLGIRRLKWLSHGGISTSTPARREAWLDRATLHFRSLEPARNTRGGSLDRLAGARRA